MGIGPGRGRNPQPVQPGLQISRHEARGGSHAPAGDVTGLGDGHRGGRQQAGVQLGAQTFDGGRRTAHHLGHHLCGRV